MNHTPPSPKAPKTTNTGERISLAGAGPESVRTLGESHQSLTSALDDAMQQLSEVTRSELNWEGVGQEDSARLFALIEAMVSAPSRREAARRVADEIAMRCQGASVQCGLGRRRMNYLYDARLGWLGGESSIHREVAKTWDAPRRRAADAPIDLAAVVKRDNSIEVYLPQPSGSNRCVIWVRGTDGEKLDWLDSAATILTLLLWSRPIRSLPPIVNRIAKRGTTTIALAAAMLVLLAIWPVHYRVACTARVETTQQRMIATPFEATLLKTNVRPGDSVSAGDVLLELDGRPLRLEREAIEAEIQQVAKEHDVALASKRVADAQQSALKKRQLSRQRDLLTDRLGRLRVISPIDGIVVSGDLERYVGSPLERGQTLIEVAPMDRMIIEVEIPEYEIGYVSEGADARVKLDAVGGESIRLPLSDVFPRAELRDEQNVFVGRIELDNTDLKLKPGMRGEAVTYGPLRPWVWSWVRSGIEKVLWWIGY